MYRAGKNNCNDDESDLDHAIKLAGDAPSQEDSTLRLRISRLSNFAPIRGPDIELLATPDDLDAAFELARQAVEPNSWASTAWPRLRIVSSSTQAIHTCLSGLKLTLIQPSTSTINEH
jgi:hypothetical protein